MDDSIYHHYRENYGEIAVRVPEKCARPLLGLIMQQANRKVDHPAAQDHGSGQVEVAHGAHGEEHKGNSQQEQ